VRTAAAKANHSLPIKFVPTDVDGLYIGAIVVSVLCLGWAIWQAKREPKGTDD
jgi:hypothetical protein